MKNWHKKLSAVIFIGIILFGSKTSAQSFSLAGLQDKFASYQKLSLQERIFIHTDKEFYVAGEIVWFKIYYVNQSNLRPLNFSKVAYVEILDGNGKSVEQGKIALDSTGGNGSFYLPLTLKTGNYTLRSYTNWMKNFDAAFFFTKRLTIVNTMKQPEETGNDSASYFADFFPEGGNLVTNLRSRVGVKVSDNNGKGIDSRGFVISSNKDTVASFSPLKFGIGSFEFQPLKGQSYVANIYTTGGKLIQKTLPSSYENGYVMNVKAVQGEKIVIAIQASFAAGTAQTREIFLTAHGTKSIDVAEKSFITNNSGTEFSIDKARLGKGVTHFTLFDQDGQPLCERLWFTGNISTLPLAVTIDKNNHVTRDRVDLKIVNTQDNNIAPADLSVAVYQIDSLSGTPQSDIVTYYGLVKELTGPVESPAYYLSGDKDAGLAMDNLLLTQGWRKFDWDEVVKGRKPVIRYIPEYKGQIITAKVTTPAGGLPNHKVDVYLSIPGTKTTLYVAETDSSGTARFDVKEYYRLGDIYAQVLNPADSNLLVNIISPYLESPQLSAQPGRFVYPETTISRKNIGMQVQNLYLGESLQRFQTPAISDTLPFYGRAEYVYKLDEYTRFTTMEEVLREYVVPVNVYMRNGKPHLKIFNFINKDFAEDNVLVMLDGVPLRDRNKIFTYDPAKVKRLDVIPQAYILSAARLEGILSFSTYDGVFDGYELDPRLLAIDYEGLQLQRKFYSPEYAGEAQLKSKLPDFRSTLYWSPKLRTDTKGNAAVSFYTGDQPGEYRVVIQGINANGEMVSMQTGFTVKKL